MSRLPMGREFTLPGKPLAFLFLRRKVDSANGGKLFVFLVLFLKLSVYTIRRTSNNKGGYIVCINPRLRAQAKDSI